MSAKTGKIGDPKELGARLREARNARGMTQAQVASELSLARTTIVAIEKGERSVKSEELVALARMYGRKVSELLRPGMPVQGLSVQLRGSQGLLGLKEGGLEQFVGQLQRFCDDYVTLERICGKPLVRQAPPLYSIEGIEPDDAAEEVADAERNRLGCGSGPLLNIRDLLEMEVGLRTFSMSLPSKVAGMYSFAKEYGGVVAVNSNHPAERRRHSLLHEYGHFLTDRYHAEVTVMGGYRRKPHGERFAESFARAFSIPSSTLRRRFHEIIRQRKMKGSSGLTPADICRLAAYFGSSFEAMAWRLEELDLLATGTWERLKQQGFSPTEAKKLLGLESSEPDEGVFSNRYRSLAMEAWVRGDISEGQLADFLHSSRVSVRRLVRSRQVSEGLSEAGGHMGLFDPLDD